MSSVARRYGLSTLLRQPYFLHWRLEGLIRPFGEYRDEVRDRSIESGFESSVLYRRGPDRTLTVRYGFTSRWILDARAGGPLGSGENLAELIRGVDTLDLDRRTSSLSLLARWGRSEDLRRRRWGWRGEASLELAGPRVLSTVEYGKVAGRLSLRVPFGQGFLFSTRGGFGRLFPYGASVPAPDGSDRLETYLRLRDATLTAGGPYDVRGWAIELLGPKVPDFRISDDDTSQLRADRYLSLGGLARLTGSLELGAPFPLLGRPHGVHVFLDAGRIWTPDDRFLPREEPLLPGELDDEVRFGTGLGVSFATPVGPVQVDLGYKLNPSPLDLRDPEAVVRALEEGRDLKDVRERGFRRWHLHLSMGGIR
jgi:outer membrane protein insertion porin family